MGRDSLATLRKNLDGKRDYIMAQPGGKEGIEAVETGWQAFEMGMTVTEATQWANIIDR